MYIENFKFTRLFRVICVTLALSFALCTVGCSKNDGESEGERILAYENIDISTVVTLGEYKGLTVTVLDGESESQAIWRIIGESSEILEYPEEQLNYYLSQARARVEYYSSVHEVSYEDALKAVGYTEESMRQEAESLVASDLLAIAVRKDAGISLTEEEKEKFFNKYAEKYAQDWGYDLEKVKDSLKEEVYDLMLYDKTSEYLVKSNTFVEAK